MTRRGRKGDVEKMKLCYVSVPSPHNECNHVLFKNVQEYPDLTHRYSPVLRTNFDMGKFQPDHHQKEPQDSIVDEQK